MSTAKKKEATKVGSKQKDVPASTPREEEVAKYACDINNELFITNLLELMKQNPNSAPREIALSLNSTDFYINPQASLTVDFIFEIVHFAANHRMNAVQTLQFLQDVKSVKSALLQGSSLEADALQIKNVVQQRFTKGDDIRDSLDFLILGILQHRRLYKKAFTMAPENRSADQSGQRYVFIERAAVPAPLRRGLPEAHYIELLAIKRGEDEAKLENRRKAELERHQHDAEQKKIQEKLADDHGELQRKLHTTNPQVQATISTLNDTLSKQLRQRQEALWERVIKLEEKLPSAIP